MPITVHTNLDNGLGAIVKMEGVVTSEEYDLAMTEYLSLPEQILKKHYYSITDATQVDKISVELKYIKKIAGECLELVKINPDVIVVIATNNTIAFNLARLWSFFTSESSWNVQVFRTREELDKWLLMKMKDIHDMSDLRLDYK